MLKLPIMRKCIGRGTYGAVWNVDDKVAIKSFERTGSFITECATCSIMRGRDNVIQYIKFDIENREIHYPLYDQNLDQWRRRNNPDNTARTYKQIMCCLRQVTVGLINIHENDYVHYDLKPHNILVTVDPDNYDNIDVVIADLGLMQTNGFSKSMYCTEVYRECVPPTTYRHDIFSLGVIFIRLLANVRITKVISHNYDILHQWAVKIGEMYHNPLLTTVISSMVNRNEVERPITRTILQMLWADEFYPRIGVMRKCRTTDRNNIQQTVEEECNALIEKYSIATPDRYLYATQYYCASRKLKKEDVKKYCLASLYITAAIFNTNKKKAKGQKREFAIHVYCLNEEGKPIVRGGKYVVLDRASREGYADIVHAMLESRTYLHIILLR